MERYNNKGRCLNPRNVVRVRGCASPAEIGQIDVNSGISHRDRRQLRLRQSLDVNLDQLAGRNWTDRRQLWGGCAYQNSPP